MKMRKLIFSAILLVLALSLFTIFTPSTKADDRYHHTTYIQAAAAPSPIGGGTSIPHLPHRQRSPAVLPTGDPKFYYWSGVTLTITHPDGNVENVTDLRLHMQEQAPIHIYASRRQLHFSSKLRRRNHSLWTQRRNNLLSLN